MPRHMKVHMRHVDISAKCISVRYNVTAPCCVTSGVSFRHAAEKCARLQGPNCLMTQSCVELSNKGLRKLPQHIMTDLRCYFTLHAYDMCACIKGHAYSRPCPKHGSKT